MNNKISEAEKYKEELIKLNEGEEDSLKKAERNISIITQDLTIINAKIDKIFLENSKENEEYKKLISNKQAEIEKLNYAIEKFENLKNEFNQKDSFLNNLENIESTNLDFYKIRYIKESNSVDVKFNVDKLIDNPINPVVGSAKDFIEYIFKNKELNIKKVRIDNINNDDVDFEFNNSDNDPVVKLAIELLSTIVNEKETEVETAFNGLCEFLKGTDVEAKLDLKVELKDGTVLDIEGIGFKFTRNRDLTNQEIENYDI